jgi:hypothetical protein
MNIALLIAGVYCLLLAITLHPTNTKSLFFITIPTVLIGLYVMFTAARLMGWIQV